MTDLPLSAHGKVDRSALLRIATDEPAPHRKATPQTAIELALAGIWGDLLQRPVDSVEQSFFSLGGHSLMAVRLFDRIRRRFGADLAISTLFSHPTIRDLAEIITRTQEASPGAVANTAPSAEWDTTIVIHPGPGGGAETPLFIVGGAGGNVNNLSDLGRALGRHRSVVGIQTRGILGHTPHATIEAMAADNIRYIRRHQPTGPYLLAGYSGGAWTAFEMARQLAADDERVAELIIIDVIAPGLTTRDDAVASPIRLSPKERIADEIRLLAVQGPAYLADRLTRKLLGLALRGKALDLVALVSPTVARSRRSAAVWHAAAKKYRGGAYAGSVSLVVSKPVGLRDERLFIEHPNIGWDRLVAATRITRKQIESNHLDMVKGTHADDLAAFMEARIEGALTSA